MPELPEVETVRRTLEQLIVGKTIREVIVSLPRIIQRPDDTEQFAFLLAGQSFQGIERRGKFLRFLLNRTVLVSHLRMEGRYGVYEQTDPVEKHTHVRFLFTDGTELRYKDVRQFGTMHLFAAGEEWVNKPLHKLGVEPLSDSFTLEVLSGKLSRPTKIKPLLLNQEHIVGLGNIYVDEALFSARIHPETPANRLKAAEVERLHTAIVSTLQSALDAGGSSIKSYVNGQGEMGMFQQTLQIYGRKNEDCYHCGEPVERIVVGGRGTHLCLSCQPLPGKTSAG